MVNLLSDMFGSRDDPACPDLPVSVDTLEHLTNLTRQQEDCEKLQMQRAAAQQQLERLDLLLSHNSQQLLASADQVNQGLKDNNQSHATRDGEEDLNYLARTMTSLRMNLADEQPGAAAAADAVQAADMAQVNVNIELADQADQVDGAEA